MTSFTEKVRRIVINDDEGAGRCWLGAYFVKDQLIEHPDIPVLPMGLRKPDSGRTTIHPMVAGEIYNRSLGKINLIGSQIHTMEERDIDEGTLVLSITSTQPPDYIKKLAFDILLSPSTDPFLSLERDLPKIATQIYFSAWLLAYTLKNNFSEIGTSKDANNIIIPRMLSQFEPKWVEDEYSVYNPQGVYQRKDIDRKGLI